MPTEVELDEIRRLIKEGDDFVVLGQHPDNVLLLGITGAGKSTLGLILTGDLRDLKHHLNPESFILKIQTIGSAPRNYYHKPYSPKYCWITTTQCSMIVPASATPGV